MEIHKSYSSTWLQVVAGELELNHECNLVHWSPEDFESKLQVSFTYLYPWFMDKFLT